MNYHLLFVNSVTIILAGFILYWIMMCFIFAILTNLIFKVSGFHQGILKLAMEPSVLGTALMEGGPDRKILLDRSPGVVFWVLISVVMVVFFSTRQCFALSVVVSLHCTLVIDVCFFSSSECNEFLFCVSILMNMIAYFLKAKIFCVYKFCCITQAHSNPTHLINNVSLEEGCRDAPFPSALYLSKNRKKKIASPSWKHYHNQKKK